MGRPGNEGISFLHLICIVLQDVFLKIYKCTPSTMRKSLQVLIPVNCDPIQEIGPKWRVHAWALFCETTVYLSKVLKYYYHSEWPFPNSLFNYGQVNRMYIQTQNLCLHVLDLWVSYMLKNLHTNHAGRWQYQFSIIIMLIKMMNVLWYGNIKMW